jgi:PST family polysaccharide transporter
VLCAWFADRPALEFNRSDLKRMIEYSWGLLGFSIVNYWSRNADQVMIGRYLGTGPLGIYSVAYRIMTLPLTQINSIAGTVALPYLAPLQNDHAQLRLAIRRLLGVLGLITTGPMLLVWLQRTLVIETVFGPTWHEVADLLFILIPIGLLQVFVNPIGLCYQISGHTNRYFKLSLIQTILTLAAFAYGVWLGTLMEIVVCYALIQALSSPITLSGGLRSIGSSLGEWLVWCFPFFMTLPVAYGMHVALVTDSTKQFGFEIDIIIALGLGLIAGVWSLPREFWRHRFP